MAWGPLCEHIGKTGSVDPPDVGEMNHMISDDTGIHTQNSKF